MMPATVATAVMHANPAVIAAAAACLARDGLVAFPTETVYGLGADATSSRAVARLYAAKQRPSFNPLISHVVDAAAAERLAVFDPAARRLASLWPGPLTLVLPKQPDCPVCELATAGLDTIAVRVPSHPIARDILHEFGRPVVAPSANRSGHISPTEAGHVLADLGGRIELVVDGGSTPVGVESTIIACLGARAVLLRPGGLSREAVEAALGRSLDPGAGPADKAVPAAPGMLASHYAPGTPVRLDATAVQEGEALLAFGPALPRGADRAVKVLNLSPQGDVVEAAANLFAHLRALDAVRPSAIAVMPIPRTGLGEAIHDRLQRAAAARTPSSPNMS